ncbi:hypothetical protein [Rothia kristinae]|uniref:hypothetical protein n=1 Tax=Rothia kristinae TaxID=37923 RepID=UPI0022E8CD88|nr:hypothetical protein [Rothia kristinae]
MAPEMEGEPPLSGDAARAARRMVGGISFALCLLGVLTVLGLLALGHPRWTLIGAAPLLAGVAGMIAVRRRLHPALRDPGQPRPRTRGRGWFLLPLGLAVLGLAAVIVGNRMPELLAGRDPGWIRNIVMLWVEIGFVLILAGGLGTGLVALSLWTVPDEDDAILRRTNYARRARERERRRDGGDPGLYDSDWLRGRRR